jgi:hypothetical protein
LWEAAKVWRDRLRAALATPNDARQANAVSAVSAVSYPDQCDKETAETAQTAEGCEGQIVAANLPLDPAANYLTQLRAFCDARAADLAGAYDAPDVLADRQAIAAEELLPPAEAADRAAIEAEPLLPADRRVAEPAADMVEELAQAMATLMLASPIYSGTTAEAALRYCRSQARRRLDLLPDPLARGLLLAAERQRAAAATSTLRAGARGAP